MEAVENNITNNVEEDIALDENELEGILSESEVVELESLPEEDYADGEGIEEPYVYDEDIAGIANTNVYVIEEEENEKKQESQERVDIKKEEKQPIEEHFEIPIKGFWDDDDETTISLEDEELEEILKEAEVQDNFSIEEGGEEDIMPINVVDPWITPPKEIISSLPEEDEESLKLEEEIMEEEIKIEMEEKGITTENEQSMLSDDSVADINMEISDGNISMEEIDERLSEVDLPEPEGDIVVTLSADEIDMLVEGQSKQEENIEEADEEEIEVDLIEEEGLVGVELVDEESGVLTTEESELEIPQEIVEEAKELEEMEAADEEEIVISPTQMEELEKEAMIEEEGVVIEEDISSIEQGETDSIEGTLDVAITDEEESSEEEIGDIVIEEPDEDLIEPLDEEEIIKEIETEIEEGYNEGDEISLEEAGLAPEDLKQATIEEQIELSDTFVPAEKYEEKQKIQETKDDKMEEDVEELVEEEPIMEIEEEIIDNVVEIEEEEVPDITSEDVEEVISLEDDMEKAAVDIGDTIEEIEELEESEDTLLMEEEMPELEVAHKEAMTDEIQERVEGLAEETKEEIKKVLKYIDDLLGALPEEKIEEFAKSEYYDIYSKLFDELGIE